MGGKRVDLTGKRFGRYLVLARSPIPGKTTNSWLCVCDCGTFKSIDTSRLKSGVVKSCGCLNRETAKQRLMTHGMTETSEYHTWASMKRRCFKKNDKSYPNYGGRGIIVCDRWSTSFENFYEDMGPKPDKDSTIERIDVNGNYEPSNCKWVPRSEQHYNKTYRSARLISPDGIRHIIKGCYIFEFCRQNDLTVSKISLVLNGKRKRHKGWTGVYLT